MPTAIEVVITNVGSRTIDDDSTADGREWLEAFRAAAETVEGVSRACWAMSDKHTDFAMHFIGTFFNQMLPVMCLTMLST